MSAPLILDGYVLEATIPARGPWPALVMRYRPALAERVTDYLGQPKLGSKGLSNSAKLLVDHLVSWDVSDGKKEVSVLPISEEAIKKLPLSYIDDMVNVVTSYSNLEQDGDVKN